jgi:transcriptional regulator with XRE-family HTH domain
MDRSNFVEKIDETLKNKGLKRQDLADHCGITVQALSEWSRKDRIPNALLVLRISRFLGVSIEWLLTDDYEDNWILPPKSEGPDKTNISPREIYWRIIYHLKSENRDLSANFDEKFFSKILHIISIDQLNALGANKYTPSIKQLYLIATCLPLPLEYLITGHSNSQVNGPDYFVYGLAQKHLNHLKTFNCLHDDERLLIGDLVDKIFMTRVKIRDALVERGIDTRTIPDLN